MIKSEFYDFKNKSGIYKIYNNKTGDFYIGSAKNLYLRLHMHKSNLLKNKHVNKFLQHSYNKYGKSNFTFEVLEECDTNLLINREQFYIDYLFPTFNLRKIAKSNLGIKWSEESKKKKKLQGRKGPIYEYNLNGEFVKEWGCAKEASEELGRSYYSVFANLNKKLPKSINSIFTYVKVDAVEPYVFKYIRKNRPTIIKQDREGNILVVYDNIDKCSLDLGTSVKNIRNIINRDPKNMDFCLRYGINNNIK